MHARTSKVEKVERVEPVEEGVPAVARPLDEVPDTGASTRIKRVRKAVDESAWGSLAVRAAAYLVGFFLLALVGSGKLVEAAPFLGGGAAAEAALLQGASIPGAPPAGSGASAAEPAHGGAEGNAKADVEGAHGASLAADAGAPSDGGQEAGKTGAAGVTPDGKVILNLATAEELQRLPGIGPAKSAAILALRAKLGRFRKVEDLRRVKGIGRRSLERLRPHCLVDSP